VNIHQKRTETGFFPWEQMPFAEWQGSVAKDPRLVQVVIETSPEQTRAREELFNAVNLTHSMRIFLREICYFRWGHWKDLRLSLTENPLTNTSPELELERSLLRFLCTLREGKAAFNTPHEESLRTQALSTKRMWIADIIEYESLIVRVRLGRYRETLPRLRELLLSLGKVSSYWAFRLRISISTGEQALGKYDASEKNLRAAQAILRHFQSAALLSTLLRRRISLALEREYFDDARALFPEALALARDSGFNVELAFLLQEYLRMCITDGLESAIQEAFVSLEACVKRFQLSPAYMSLIEERCELALRTEKPAEALELLSDFVQGATLRKEVAGVCIGLMYEARALHAQQNFAQARVCIDNALALAREQEYGKARVRILFYASALARENGEGVRSRLLLEEAGTLASQMGLPVQTLCYRIAVENFEIEKPSIAPLVEALASLAAFQELFHYLKFYGFFANRSVRLSLSGKIHETRLLQELLTEIHNVPALYWFENERILLLCSQTKKTVILKLDERFPMEASAVLLLRRAALGASTERLHQLTYPNVRYRSDVHGGRLRMLMSRMRKCLEPLGCDVVFERSSQRYFIRTGVPFITVRAPEVPSLSEEKKGLRPREEELLNLLRNEGRLTTAALCAHMNVTRQTLHPWLTRLVRAGLIRSFGYGRARSYEAISLQK